MTLRDGAGAGAGAGVDSDATGGTESVNIVLDSNDDMRND